MPFQHSPPAIKTRSQARTQSVITLTPRAPLDSSPAVPHLRAHLDRGQFMEGEEPSRKEGRGPKKTNSFLGVVGTSTGIQNTTLTGLGEDYVEEEQNYVEEKESDSTEASPAPVGESQGTGGPNLAQSNHPVSHKSEISLLAIMQQIPQIMDNVQAASSSEAPRHPL
ncbi:hypothetical protein O181_040800 [Austropuccinia psidii MF-1]|uniref:Uncharacterized protein n=1 Tax=Austropuccinia psidii MF-1 TaxID=1389203 RepID=A0A9Q3HGJ2_9BASI|nr:hypothetical protein [Austropuccinia psidii MF-1]